MRLAQGWDRELVGGHMVSVCYCSGSSATRESKYASAFRRFSAFRSSSNRCPSAFPRSRNMLESCADEICRHSCSHRSNTEGRSPSWLVDHPEQQQECPGPHTIGVEDPERLPPSLTHLSADNAGYLGPGTSLVWARGTMGGVACVSTPLRRQTRRCRIACRWGEAAPSW